MGKRSTGVFERRERDSYDTPLSAVLPLLPHLPEWAHFIEPCAGNGELVKHLEHRGQMCVAYSDITHGVDATTHKYHLKGASHFITNPPWKREILHPLILNLSSQLPTWLLFDADWMHTKQSIPFLPHLQAIVSVGRVKWIPDSTMTGKDNCCWYLFQQGIDSHHAEFYGRE